MENEPIKPVNINFKGLNITGDIYEMRFKPYPILKEADYCDIQVSREWIELRFF